MRRQRSLTAVIGVALLATALALVHVRHQNRMTFLEFQALQQERDRLNVEWGRLLLEQGTWSVHHIVEQTARTELDMVKPQPEQIVTLTLPGEEEQ